MAQDAFTIEDPGVIIEILVRTYAERIAIVGSVARREKGTPILFSPSLFTPPYSRHFR